MNFLSFILLVTASAVDARSVRGVLQQPGRKLFSIAQLKNQEAREEEPPQCPEVPEVPCIYIYAPVKCGAEKQCEYDNFCLSTNAGFAADDCISIQCPTGEGLVPCTAEYAPVICGVGDERCEYVNICSAKHAGYSADDCEP